MAGEESLSGPPRIERAPEAASFEIEKLIELGRLGELRIPHFQRRFKWTNADRLALFDSIELGYPIGTLLLWKRSGSFEGGLLEGAAPSTRSESAYWVVDGQQRITTLWDALARRPQDNEACLCFDFDQLKFRFLPPAASGNRIPMYVVSDAAELGEWLVAHQWPVERMRLAFELGKRIRQYSVPAYIVKAGEEAAVRHIFDRTNSTGKALNRDEVFDAFAGTGLGDTQKKGLDRVNDRLADIRFGRFERTTILNVFEAVLEYRIGKSPLQKIGEEESERGLERTTEALKRVANFLKSSAHIPHVALVPYEMAIVVLARLFDLFPKLSARNRILLRRWLWRAALRQKLTGASGSPQEHIDDLVAGGEDASIQRLLARTGQGHAPSLDFTKSLSFASALGKLQVCALVAMKPRDLGTGDVIDLCELFDESGASGVRKIVRTSDDEEKLTKTIANRFIHPPIRGMSPVRLMIDASDPAALASHAIDEEALDALRSGDGGKFLRRREIRLTRWIEQFYGQHAEWGADDSKAIASLRRSA